MVGIFERQEKEPLEFKVGDKIMGYHTGPGIWILIAGEVVEVMQSNSYLHDNEYNVRLIPELLDNGMKEGVTFRISENEARPFDEIRVLQAVKHWKNEIRLRAEASEENIRMLELLYPEDYKDKKKEKDT